jgi:hypothetical protein
MRFGIMAMQFNALIPPALPPEQIPAHIAGFDHAVLVQGLVERGFRLIELGGDLALFLPHTFTPAAIERLAVLKAALGLSYTIHLPLWSVEPSTPRPGAPRWCRLWSKPCAVQPLEPGIIAAPPAPGPNSTACACPKPARSSAPVPGQRRQSLQAILAETGLSPASWPSKRSNSIRADAELAEALDLSMCLIPGMCGL